MDPKKQKKKTKSLYQIRYILQFSFIKTLTCKYKSTVPTFFKRLGSRKLLEELFLKENIFSLIFQELLLLC